jgi:chromosome segregation protein
MSSRLKSLELLGYKTFASRTLFEFAGAVTCIVGPNGSGKSNIADSLRWVLGEQSYTLLRGKRTEDMIFSGSEQRPRAGMASATVVFDNSDGWLPIDFSEVAITRRAYRDGENEYLVNGQRVRLKDVGELLAQSGLAERTYTIIGQGVVDAALALKPEERRRLFEEAAGIGLHRTRRDEALRKLDTTRRNLDRVKDILAELQPRLRSLERQARRSLEYEKVKEDLRVLLRQWYGYHWHAAQKEVASARALARAKERELQTARQEQAILAQQLNVLREQILSLRTVLNDLHRQQAGLHSRREELSRQLAVAEERIRSSREQVQALDGEFSRLEEDLALQKERLESARQAVDRQESEIAEAGSQAEAAARGLEARQAERQEAEASYKALRQVLTALQTRRDMFQARREETTSQLEGQRKALETSQQLLSAAEAARAQAQDRYQRARQSLTDAEAATRKVDSDLAALRKKVADVDASRTTVLDEHATLQATIVRLQTQIEVLDQAEASLSGYASGAQVLLNATRQKRLPGARGALSAYLDVQPELEVAIAAALGEYLDALVLEKGATDDVALDLLASQSARGVLLPLDRAAPGKRLSYSGEGVAGVAADLVKAGPDLVEILDVLLGNTLIVNDRATARRVLRGQSPGVRAVTLRGEIFHASGPVVAGLDARPASLSRPRQKKELSSTLAQADTHAISVRTRLSELDERLSTMRQEDERLEAALRVSRQQEDQARKSFNHETVELEQISQRVTWQTEQQRNIQAGIGRMEAALASLATDLALLGDELGAAEDAARAGAIVVDDVDLDEHQSRLTYWNALVEANRRSLSEAQMRMREQQMLYDRAEAALSSARTRQQALQVSLAKVDADRAAWRQAEGEVSLQITALREQIEPTEAELEDAENRQTDQQAIEAAARQALTLAEHTHAQAHLGQSRAQEALDNLRQRIQDDFGLVAFDYVDDISGPTPLPLDGMVEQLPRITQLAPEVEENLKQQRALLRRIGPINPEAQAEYREVKERFEFMTSQVADLEQAETDVRRVISELDELMERELLRTFEAVSEEFSILFTRLFGGGSARLKLTNADDVTNTGVDIEARLPGRRVQGLSLLSGGERSLTAAALIFALIKISPTPFCVLDEVDAMLDEANVGRFRDLLRELSLTTQFIVVTHNRNTVQAADVIYGVTMGRDSSSQVISLKMDEISKVV